METLWYVLLAFMITAYVLLDGFDLGAGIAVTFVAKTPEERRLVIRTIGPVWDGNEVWLLAAGGALFFAFPLAYASSFSGFYLSLMMVLWLLMLRGIGVELRSHVEDPLWWTACDFVFASASFMLALFFGVAVGNVVRGVPLDGTHYFFEPLWTTFRTGPTAGILDWYTVLTGAVAVATLTMHGAAYVAMKTEGEVSTRSKRVVNVAWIAVVLLTIGSLVATLSIRPEMLANYYRQPWGWIIPAMVGIALLAIPHYRYRDNDAGTFLATSAYIVGMLGGAAFAMYPDLLHASTGAQYSLNVHNAKTGAYSLRVGAIWWLIGLALAIGYFTFVYRSFRGKVSGEETEGGY